MRRTLPLLAALLLGACGDDGPSPVHTDFVVTVQGEDFVLRVVDAETVRQAMANMRGENNMFPIGPLRSGDGGFNAPWSWHFDPDDVRFTEAAIELCDGTPSYVEAHLADYPSYCPWAARVASVRPAS
jgi:hypothetical protein